MNCDIRSSSLDLGPALSQFISILSVKKPFSLFYTGMVVHSKHRKLWANS